MAYLKHPRSYRQFRIAIIILQFFFCLSARAQQPIELFDTSRITVIGHRVALFEDSARKYTINEIAAPSFQNNFRRSGSDIPNYNVTRSRVWTRVQFINRSERGKWYLECTNPNVNEVTVYQKTGRYSFRQFQSGFNTLPEGREIKVHDIIFTLELPKDSVVTVYLSMSDILPLQIYLSAGSSERFLENYEARNFLHGAFFGLLLMLVIYNFFIYISVGDRVYLFYVLYVICNAWFISFLTGYGIHVPFLAGVLRSHPAIVPYFLGAASCLFSIVFLDMKRTYRRGYRITVFMFFLLLTVPALDLLGKKVEAILLVQLYGLSFSIVSFIFGMIIYRRGYSSAKFYLLGWTAYLIGLVLHITADLRLIPFNAFTHNSLEIFTAIEAILLSMAVGDKISLFKKEKEQAQQESLAAAMKNEQLVREQNVILGERVKERTFELEEQKKIVEEKNKEIVDSINYARRIQYALLAHESLLKRNLPEHFVFFKPKDIVSGDFYWASEKHHRFYLAVCDSTGHGVPGAFMSLLNISYLNEAINDEILEPDLVFDRVRKRLIESISQNGAQDGMDAVMLCIDKENGKITSAAANNSIVHVSGGEAFHMPADKMPIGKGESIKPFSNHELSVKKGDMIYLYTDGFADQFGGPKGKKFKYRQLDELLIAISPLSMQEQKQRLEEAFSNWKGDLEQVDDVCVAGLRI